MARIGLISLGCPKNVVDAEQMLGEVTRAGHEIEADPSLADVIIVNTCGFIQSAKEESIGEILNAVRYKTNGACRSVIVTGCLAQRYGTELADEIPEADGFISLGKASEIAAVIARTLEGQRVVDIGEPNAWWREPAGRVLSTPGWTAYLRVADGCDNRCTYCAIPSIRGGFASRREQDIIDEAKALADLGVEELNLVAQDVTRYGQDTYGALRLPHLLESLSAIEGIEWLRLLYCYPTRVTDELIRVMAENEKVCKYMDLPLQHCSESVLRAMARQGTKDSYLRLFDKLREACPEIALRTSFIVGFPGETDADFDELAEFVQTVRFDRVGVFKYSREDGTPAAEFTPRVTRRVADSRLSRLMSIQQGISLARNESFVGSRMRVLVEGDKGRSLVGRSYRDAPEIDGLVYISDAIGRCSPGDFVTVEITEGSRYDLAGHLTE